MKKQNLNAEFMMNLTNGVEVGIETIDITGQMKVLRELTKETSNIDNTHSIILQHILPTTIEYIDLVNSVYPVDLVISIVYSTDVPTVKYLRDKGYNVLVPQSIDYMKNELWKDIAKILESSKNPIIFQEVGGYMAKWTHELSKYNVLKGCVEDTKNGLWSYLDAQNNGGLKLPVLSMADTALKRVEDSLIGDACVYSLEKALRTQFASTLHGIRCGIVGWGNIGKSCAEAFEGKNSIVSIYDINPIVNMLAFGKGYDPMPLSQLLSECDIIMGCSGRKSIRVADINDIKNGALLCSASSKDIEIDLKGFSKICDIEDLSPVGKGLCPIEKYTVRETQKYFYVLKHGTPIDFLDNPLQGAILDCTFSELFVCLREISNNPHPNGVLELKEELQVAVAKKWLPVYAETFSSSESLKDKTFYYRESWNWE